MRPSLAQTSMENGYYCPLRRLWASDQAGSLEAAAEGQKGSAAVLRSGTKAWTQQRKPSAWSSCYRCELGCMLEADSAGPASLPMLPGPGRQSAACPASTPPTTGLLSLPPPMPLLSTLSPSPFLLFSRSIHLFCLNPSPLTFFPLLLFFSLSLSRS